MAQSEGDAKDDEEEEEKKADENDDKEEEEQEEEVEVKDAQVFYRYCRSL